MKNTRKLMLLLMLTILLSSCANVNTCPDFPIPSAEAAQAMHELSQHNEAVKEWGNELLKLKEKLSID